jgi:hypothetical protein
MAIFRAVRGAIGGIALAGSMTSAHADGWLCVSDKSTGFSYDKFTKSWNISNFHADNKYIVRRPNAKDIKTWGDIDSTLHLEYLMFPMGEEVLFDGFTPNERPCDQPISQVNAKESLYSGVLICKWGLDTFSINTRTLRMQYHYAMGYIQQGNGPLPYDQVDTPFLEIGKCSPL